MGATFWTKISEKAVIVCILNQNLGTNFQGNISINLAYDIEIN